MASLRTRGGAARLPVQLLLVLLLGPGADAVVALTGVRRAPAMQRATRSAARMQSDAPPPPAPPAGDSDSLAKLTGAGAGTGDGLGLIGREGPDLTGLSFEERLAALSKQYENFQPVDPAEMKEREKNAPAREWDDDEKPWKPEFWALIAEDLRTVEYPSSKKVFQTFLISQVAFIVVIVVTLLFDAVCDASVKSLLLGEEFSLSMDKIMKVAETNAGR